jgi:tetratricopeptide (TPR) repeat protein/predicted Ser/Thr protein kinase
MTESQWIRIEEHFAAIGDLPESDRAAALAAIDDPEVRAEVGSLLQHRTGTGTETWTAIGGVAAEFATGAPEDRRIGPYRIVRRLGEGSQGTVFEALRDDGNFEQRVAIKVVRWETDSPTVRDRFRQERQILAGLSHPNIARLFDGGETDSGNPYLVMEFVEGLQLIRATETWDQRRKLALLLKICDAVAYAHRKLIVHRDIKPANILVNAEGEPKLLDFGIARLLDADGQQTQTGFVALTPQYASPEQVRSEPVTTASDVYSLGVVAYQILCGRKPYDVHGTSLAELDRVVCVDPPAPPALGNDDLDQILLMALRKEPERRYGTVQEFAADLQRFLANEPVRAKADTVGYRWGKFVRRNWWQLAAAAAVLVSLTSGLAVAVVQEQRANRRFNQVRQLANEFIGFYSEVQSTPGTVKLREKMVRTALRYLDSLAGDASGDVSLQFELAVAYAKVADAQGSGTRPSLMRPKDGKVSYEKAVSLARPLADRELLDKSQRILFVAMLTDFGALLRTAEVFDGPRATRLGREAVRRSIGLPSAEQRRAYSELASTLGKTGQLAEAVRTWEDLLGLVRAEERVHPTLRSRGFLAATLQNTGYFEARVTDFQAAVTNQTEAISRLRQLAKERPPGDPITQTYLATSLNDLGLALSASDRPSLGNYAAAMEAYTEAVSVYEALIAADPKDAQSQYNLGLVYTQMTGVAATAAPRQAVTYGKNAVALLAGRAAEELGRAKINLAGAYRNLRDFEAARRTLDEVAKLAPNAGDWGLDDAEMELEFARGNLAGAVAHLPAAVAVQERALAEAATPGHAWETEQVLEFAAKVQPESAKARRERIGAVWADQEQRFPGRPWITKHAAEARLRASQ